MTFKKTLITLLAGAFLLPAAAFADEKRTLQFQPTEEIFPNPERGMFHHLEFHTDDAESLSASYLQRIRRDDGMSLVFTVYVMKAFRDGSDISEAYLNRIKANMKTLRQEGFKTVLRFCYSYSERDYPRDVPWYVCQRHIEQLTPILQEYSDVIALLEAGFIGAWGEWYYTDNYGQSPNNFDDYAPRKAVLEALLDAMPKSRFVSVRYPAAKLGIFRLGAPQTINITTAYNESNISRTGFHNDCFLGDADDVGTFGGNAHYRQYWKTESQFVPMGGETCTNPNDYTERTYAEKNFEDYHWSYLNLDYHPGTIGEWESNNFLQTVRRKLGYRLRINSGECDDTAEAGHDWHLKLKIENVGWAAPYNPRDVELIFQPVDGDGEDFIYKVDADPRFWFAGTVSDLDVAVPLPSGLKAGSYTVSLNLPDPCETIHDDPRYSIRLANAGIWNITTGYNKITTVEVLEDAAVEGIQNDSDSLVDVSDTRGLTIRRAVPRSAALDGLPPGLYIIDSQKILKK